LIPQPVPNGQDRIQEAAKHGFRRLIVPKENAPRKPIKDLEVLPVARLADALGLL